MTHEIKEPKQIKKGEESKELQDLVEATVPAPGRPVAGQDDDACRYAAPADDRRGNIGPPGDGLGNLGASSAGDPMLIDQEYDAFDWDEIKLGMQEH